MHLAWAIGHALMRGACAALLLASAAPAAQANWLAKLAARRGGRGGGSEAARFGAVGLERAAAHIERLPADGEGLRARRPRHARGALEVRQPRRRGVHRRHARRIEARRADAAARGRRRRQASRIYLERGHGVRRPRAAARICPQGASLLRRRRHATAIRWCAARDAGAGCAVCRPCAPTSSSSSARRRRCSRRRSPSSSGPLSRASIRTLALEPGGPATLSSSPRLDPQTKTALVDAIDPPTLAGALRSVRGPDGAGHRAASRTTCCCSARRAGPSRASSCATLIARGGRRRRQSGHPARAGAAPAGRAQLAVAAHRRRRARRRLEAGDARRFPRRAGRRAAASSASACSARAAAASSSAPIRRRVRRRADHRRRRRLAVEGGLQRHRQRGDERGRGARARRGAPEGARPPHRARSSRRTIRSPISSASLPGCSAGRSRATGGSASGRRSSAASTAARPAIAPRRPCACWPSCWCSCRSSACPALLGSLLLQLWGFVTLPFRFVRWLTSRDAGEGGLRPRRWRGSRARRCSSPARAAASGSRSPSARRATAPTSPSSPRRRSRNPKLEGTIETAAAEIEAAGGRALALACDIRFEEQVAARRRRDGRRVRRHRHLRQQRERAVARAASSETTMKRFDLDARRQHARHVPRHQDVPAASAGRRQTRTC